MATVRATGEYLITATIVRRAFSVEDYRRMREIGILREDDRAEKLPCYAASGIGEVWIIDIAAKRIEQHSRPRGALYSDKRTFEQDVLVAALNVPGLRVRPAQIFGSYGLPVNDPRCLTPAG